MSGKGSKQRPTDTQKYGDNWDRIFLNKEPNYSTCNKCGGDMIKSKAIEQTYTSGLPDFIGDEVGITMSPSGSGKLIDCMKCKECGWSVR